MPPACPFTDMCGIAGIFHPDVPKPVDPERVRAMADMLVHRGPDQSRGGLSIDWAPGGGPWKLMAERYRQEGAHFARAGLRWTPAKDWTLDLSRAVVLRGPGDRSWTIGLTREFDR